jgi:ribosomal RNA-processing protein 8
MTKTYRYYQSEADQAIYDELQLSDKCIVKMFCGTGKSLLMRKCKILQNQNLVVYVFPSLQLIRQFYDDYLKDYPQENILKISSDTDKYKDEDKDEMSTLDGNKSTTDKKIIQEFILKNTNKIVCVTYQSYETLIDNLNGTLINTCVYDESHHAVGETYQKLIFNNDICQKQIFFTATPKNSNGIIMYDRHKLDENMCGKLVYDYSYLKGVFEDYLNPFEIRIDLFTENTNKSLFESIARAILTTGNNRVLTFHADVNAKRDTSVNLFVNQEEFIKVFQEVKKKEFPNIKKYNVKNIKMISFSSKINIEDRKHLLEQFDETSDDHIIIISSCETIGEGIDTKNANMCVFIDPKSSYVKIIQNIGRIVRKPIGKINAPNSTVLIPCWVDKNKYIDCNEDKDKCDAVIRQDMGEGGNFNCILNVLSALRQEDEDIYDICLHYPDTFSPQEIKSNLEKQGFITDDVIGDGGIVETCEHLLDQELDYDEFEDCETDNDIVMKIAEDNDVCVEVHTDSLENPIEKYNPNGKETIRVYKCEQNEDEEDTQVYQPIVKKDGVKKSPKSDQIKAPNRHKRSQIKVHTNPDVKVLWKISSDIDLVKDMCSCVIDCEIVDTWFDRFEKLKKFIDENNKRPSVYSKNITEKSLGKWCQCQKYNYMNKTFSMKEEIKRNKWSEFIEIYNEYFVGQEDLWELNFNKLKEFVNYNKRTPKYNLNDDNETNLHSWLSNQKTRYKNKSGGMTDEERYNKWSEFLNNNKELFKSLDDKWDQNFIDLKEFIKKMKKLPFQTSINKEEKQLGNWVCGQRIMYKNKSGGMADEERYNKWTELLDEYKEHFINLDEKWEQNLVKLTDFIETNKKRPSEKSKNEVEKKLSRWCSDQQKYYNKKLGAMKHEERYNKWTLFLEEYKQYFLSNNDLWDYNLTELKDFMRKNKLKPSKNEKKHYNFLRHQNEDYEKKKGGMKDNERYNKWTEFLEEFKEHFGKDNSMSTTSSLEEEKEYFDIIPKKSMKLTKPKKVLEKQLVEERRQRNKSELSVLHQRYKTMTSSNLHNAFKEDVELWHNYHKIAEENEKSFPDEGIPRNCIIQELDKIKTKRRKLIVDMGCGKAQIAEHFKRDNRFEFINYDHIAINDNVTECDISNVPLEDDSVEICILSLAMWGSNCREYIMEANRMLESNGKLYIIEPTKRWSEQDDSGNIITGKECVKLKKVLLENGFKIIEENIEKFTLFVCVKM